MGKKEKKDQKCPKPGNENGPNPPMDFPVRRHKKPSERKQRTHRHHQPVKVMIEVRCKACQLQLILMASRRVSDQQWVSIGRRIVDKEDHRHRQAPEQEKEQRSGREAQAEENGDEQENTGWSDKKPHAEGGAGK